jgi:hypothetical protein
VIERSVDIYWKKRHEDYAGKPSGETTVLFIEKAGSKREFQSSRQINEEDSLRNPSWQHFGHGFGVNEVSDACKNEQEAKAGRGRALRIVTTMRDAGQQTN